MFLTSEYLFEYISIPGLHAKTSCIYDLDKMLRKRKNKYLDRV